MLFNTDDCEPREHLTVDRNRYLIVTCIKKTNIVLLISVLLDRCIFDKY